MKKYIVSFLLAGFCSVAFASQFNKPSSHGFIGPNAQAQTIKSVKKIRFFNLFKDDKPVVLTGYITRALGGDLYSFHDDTGEITLEIDHEIWYGLSAITPDTKITVYGELENYFFNTQVEVDKIRPAA